MQFYGERRELVDSVWWRRSGWRAVTSWPSLTQTPPYPHLWWFQACEAVWWSCWRLWHRCCHAPQFPRPLPRCWCSQQQVWSLWFEACGHSPEDKRGPACFYVQKDADKLSPSKSFLLTSHCYRWSYDCLNSIWTPEGSPGRIEEAEKFIRFSYSCDQDVRINTDGGDWGFLKEATANGNSTRCN